MMSRLKKNGSGGFLSIVIYFLLLIILVSNASCDWEHSKNKIQMHVGEYKFPYNLEEPDSVYYLPSSLVEISGLSYYKKNKLACIQDEEAIIYIYDTEEGKITSEYPFGKKGDFEGIATIKDTAFILRSDGTIFEVKNFKDEEREVNVNETILDKSNNTEGLCVDKNNNSLLIACKEASGLKGEPGRNNYKSVFKFNLNTAKLKENPEYSINLSQIARYKKTGVIRKFYIKVIKKLNLINNDIYFNPSAIAVHPIDNDKIFVLSHIGKLLIVMNRKSRIEVIHSLDSIIFGQPEGICFSDDGTLYISNEGNNDQGNILKFRYRP